jgi:hypothetical protein
MSPSRRAFRQCNSWSVGRSRSSRPTPAASLPRDVERRASRCDIGHVVLQGITRSDARSVRVVSGCGVRDAVVVPAMRLWCPRCGCGARDGVVVSAMGLWCPRCGCGVRDAVWCPRCIRLWRRDAVVVSAMHPVVASAMHPVVASAMHPVVASAASGLWRRRCIRLVASAMHPVVASAMHPLVASAMHPACGVGDVSGLPKCARIYIGAIYFVNFLRRLECVNEATDGRVAEVEAACWRAAHAAQAARWQAARGR